MSEKKKFHWIHDDIKIDFKVSKNLQWLMEEAERLDLAEDWGYFPIADQIDVDAKNCVAIGTLTQAQWDKLAARYDEW